MPRIAILAAFLTLAVTGLAPRAWAQAPNAIVQPTRTSGVAPLAVLFDATGTTHASVDAFHDLDYQWTFGDPNAGTWAISGQDKNRAIGAVAAHVFDTAGTYKVTLTVTDPAGHQDVVNTTIQVQDPNAVFSGQNTICVRASSSGGFGGCPAGAATVTDGSWPSVAALLGGGGRRVLLRRGDQWGGGGGRAKVSGPALIGAFGSGAKPRINVSGQAFSISSSHDLRVMDLAFVGPTSTANSTSALTADDTRAAAKNVLFYRVETTGFHSNVFEDSGLHWTGTDEIHDGMFFVEMKIADTGYWGLLLAVTRSAVLGTEIRNTGSHCIRTGYLDRSVIEHNLIHKASSANTSTAYMKLHAPNFKNNQPPTNGKYSQLYIVSDNHLIGQNRPWMVTIAPQNSQEDERIRDVIVERNYFEAGPLTQKFIVVAARDVTIRNNIFNMAPQPSHGAVTVTQRGIEPPPANVRAFNNTCYSDTTTGSVQCTQLGGWPGTIAENNLLFAPNRLHPGGEFSASTERSNLIPGANPFVVASPTAPADFALKAGSAPVNAGLSLGSVTVDFFGLARPAGGSLDVGAAEYGAGPIPIGGGGGGGGGGGPTTPPAAPVLLP